jgi:hypothetical protein
MHGCGHITDANPSVVKFFLNFKMIKNIWTRSSELEYKYASWCILILLFSFVAFKQCCGSVTFCYGSGFGTLLHLHQTLKDNQS